MSPVKEIRQLRGRLDAACMRAAAVDPNGNEIEHCNHAIIEVAHALGAALNTRVPRPSALHKLGNR